MLGNLYQVIDNVLEELKMTKYVEVNVSHEPEQFYILEFRNKKVPDAYLKVEIPKCPAGQPYGCVLERHNVGRRTMARIMDSLMYHLTPENMRD